MVVSVRQLAPGPSSAADVEAAVEWLDDAYANDPVMPPSLGGDWNLSKNLWRAFIAAGLVGGEVYVAGADSDSDSTAVDGVAVWFPPGTEFLATPEQQAVWHDAFAQHINDDARVFWEQSFEGTCNVISARIPDADKAAFPPLWLLQFIATRKSAQRKGVARALIEHITAKDKTAGIRLETFTELNVSIYERLGFVNKGGPEPLTTPSPHGDMRIWLMFKLPA